MTIDFTAIDFNASGNLLVLGYPPLTGIDGLVHCIERDTGIRVIGWALGVRSLDLKNGHMKPVNYEHRHKSKHADTPYIRDRRSATLTGNLLIQISDNDLPDDICESLEDRIESLRFCGGNIRLGESGVSLWHTTYDALRLIAVSHEQSPFFLEDKSQLLDEAPAGLSKTEWLMDLTAGPYRNEDGDFVYAHGQDFLGYLIPTINGYQLLEEPREREELRNEYKHAHGEATIGLGRLRSLGSLMTHWNEATDNGVEIYWFGSFGPDPKTWRLLTF